MLAFEIPDSDSREFYGLPEPVRDRVRWLLRCMRSIATAPKKRKTAACHEVARGADMCFNAIYGIWRRFSETGDWRVLIDKRKTSEFWKRDDTKIIELPPKFIDHWKLLCESNDRAMRPAHARLIRDWKAWRAGDLTKAIPGYDRCPDAAPGGRIPRGWTYSNLLNHRPTDVEIAAARKGRVEAKKLLPGIRLTRVGSYPFAEVQFDDMWHAFEVNVLGHKRQYRLLEFGSVDAFSTFIFRPGLKPRVQDMDTGRMKALNERDFHLYAVNWLLDHGIHPDGTILNAENGTARFSKSLQDRLVGIYGDRITFVTGGMSGAPALPGGWKERAKGNPNAKALKEGLGKLIQGALGHLPGQTGKHYLDAPASLIGRGDDNEMLLALAAVVPGLREKLRLGFLDLAEAVHAVHETYDALNMRTDHSIEGWAECGLVIDEFRFSRMADDWRPLQDTLALQEHERELLALTLKMDPGLRRRRNLSPAECLLAHRERLIRPPLESVPDLLGPDYGEKRTVKGGTITFTRPDTGKLRFNAKYQDAGGFVRRLDNGTEILAHLNPWKPDWLWISDLRSGRFIGRAPRDLTPVRGDLDAIHRAHGRAEADYLDAVAAVASRHGAARIPHLKANTAALRAAARPDTRGQSLAATGFSAADLLEAPEEDDTGTTAAASSFDPADLL